MQFNFFNHGISNIHAAALILGAAGLLSRLLGVLRDRLLASTFGAGRELDIYYAAFQIPDFMSVLFFLGAGSAAILPIFQEYLARGREEARHLISSLSSLFLAAAILLSLIIFFVAPFLMPFIVPGFSPAEQGLTVTLVRILLLSPVLLGLSSIFSAVVQSFERFWAFALAPVLYNLGIIAGILFFVPVWGVPGLGAGVILGALLHFGIQFAAVKRLGFVPYLVRYNLYRTKYGTNYSGVREVLKISFPRALSISLSQITLLVLIAIGSTLTAGSIAVFQFAQNLYFLPIGIFAVSYATAIFPRLSRSYIARDAETFFRELYLGIRTILFWILPSAVLFIVLRAHTVRVALGAGAFSWEDTRLTAASLGLLAVGMAAGGLIIFLLRGFYALEKTWRPLAINIISSLLTVGLAYAVVALMRIPGPFEAALKSLLRLEGLPNAEVIGLALGFMLGTVVNTWLLYAQLMGLAKRVFNYEPSFPVREMGKLIIASAGAGFAAYAARLGFKGIVPLDTFGQVFFQGSAAGLAGIGVYVLILYILRSEDLLGLWKGLEKRLLKIGVLPRSWDGETRI